MNSSRLPGKVLKPLAGKPVLQWLFEGLERVRNADCLVVATSQQSENREIVKFCRRHKVAVYQGSEDNVLSRYAAVAEIYDLDHVVRCTGDNPLSDAVEIDYLIRQHLQSGADYTSNVESLPKGIGAEIFRSSTLIRLNSVCTDPEDLEHVNEYILKNPNQFTILLIPPIQKQFEGCNLSFSIDTLEDFSWMENFCRMLPTSGQITGGVVQKARYFIHSPSATPK